MNHEKHGPQIGRLLGEVAALLSTIRCPNDGYQLLLERTETDLDWFSGKLISAQQMAYIPNHMTSMAQEAIGHLMEEVQELQKSIGEK